MDRLIVERRASGMEFSYPIVWKDNFEQLSEEVAAAGLHPGKICVVADSNVAPLYLKDVAASLSGCCKKVETYVFPAGEENKNLGQVNLLYEFLIQNHFERRDLLAALGGGVTGDLTGFVAATYLRGIDFIQIPTTLLAQVDSSVGGKTGVDCDQYKNMVGAFHQPRLVYMNMTTLHSLPDEQFASGMGEVLKTGLIRDRDFYCRLRDQADIVLSKDPDVMADTVRTCCRIKASVVEEDPKDTGIRGILNFGHTLGHAVEKCMNFTMLHGQCVALGTVGAAWLSMKKGYLTSEEYEMIRSVNERYHLPVSVSGLSAEQIVRTTKSDKKMEGGRISFILLRSVGDAYIDRSLTDEDLEAAAGILIR